VNTHARVLLLGLLAALVAAMWVFAFLSKHFERVAAGVAALPPAEFERLTVLALGTGGTFENHWRRGPALGVGLGTDVVLVDAGRGVAEGLRAAAVPVEQPRALLLTSVAAENVLGLDELWLTGWLRGREAPLHVYGPPGTRALVDGVARALAAQADAQGEAFTLPDAGRGLVAHEFVTPAELALGGLAVRATPLAGGPLAALSWRLEGGGHSVAVTFGSAEADALVAAAAGADFWVSEAVYGVSLERARESGTEGLELLLAEAATHPTLEALGALAARAEVRSLVLVRLRPPAPFAWQYERVIEEGGFRGPVHVPEDGDQLTP
jgi:ribonuclease BN (tRNA processing enzyme)